MHRSRGLVGATNHPQAALTLDASRRPHLVNVRWRDVPPGPVGRVLGAIVGTVFGGGTAFAIPWMMFADQSVWYGFVVPVWRVYLMSPFYAWVVFVSLYAMAIGFRLGIFGIFDLFNLMWNTGDTNDTHVRELATRYRVLIPMAAGIAMALAWLPRVVARFL